MKKTKGNQVWWCFGEGGIFWGLLFLSLGTWFLAKELGFVALNISIWPIILILLGVWLIFKRKNW